MSFSVLEEQVKELPLDLQRNIEMYALFVINQYKNSVLKDSGRGNIAEILDSLTGIIPYDETLTIDSIRNERLSQKYGI